MNAGSRIVVVSAPSGTGKTTLNRRLVREHHDKIMLSVSYTTRQQRKGESSGVDYHYVAPDKFKELIAEGEMLEYAEVFGTYYGTSMKEIRRIQGLGRTPLLEIDVQGWGQARHVLKDAISVFILPPTIESLWKRLEKRGTEDRAVRWRRLRTARQEIMAGHNYHYFVVNEAVESAYAELKDIIINGKSGKIGNAEGSQLCATLLEEFDEAPWLAKLSKEFADK